MAAATAGSEPERVQPALNPVSGSIIHAEAPDHIQHDKCMSNGTNNPQTVTVTTTSDLEMVEVEGTTGRRRDERRR